MNNISEIQKSILELRQKKGYNIENVLCELKITRNNYKKEVEKLKELNLYDEEKVKKAIKNRQRKEKKQSAPKIEISEEEKDFRRKCVTILSENYLDYKKNKKFNPQLITKLTELSKKSNYKTIYYTILAQKNSLEYGSKKTFSSDYNKILYLISIIRNNLENTKQKMQENENNIAQDSLDLIESLGKEIISQPTDRLDMTDLIDID